MHVHRSGTRTIKPNQKSGMSQRLLLGHSQNQRNLEACGRRDGLEGQRSLHFSPDIISALATPAKSYLSLILLHITPQFPNWEQGCDLLQVFTALHSIHLLLASSSLTPKFTWRPTTMSVKDLGETKTIIG